MDLDTKIVILSALVQKLWSKMSFCTMVANVMHSRTSHIQIAQDVFDLLKGPNQSYPVVKFSGNLSSRNRDMAQNVMLLCCDLERQGQKVFY